MTYSRKPSGCATNAASVITFDLQRHAGDEYMSQIGGAITQPKKN